jgi:hypothetical protein
VIDRDGRIRPAAVSGVSALPAPTAGCGWRVGQGTTTIPLQRATLPFTWTVRIGYISSRASPGVVTVGGSTTPVTFHDGLGAVYLPAAGAVTQVAIGGLDPGTTLCTDEVVVGAPVPAGGGS